jgi:D-alanine-D-alanine ligase
MGLRVALLYNLASSAPKSADAPSDALAELDSMKNVEAYAKALRDAGHTVFPLEGDASLLSKLRRLKIDLCFNTCEGYSGDSREAQVPALLEMIGIPYTAARVLGLAITLDKAMTKRVLMYHGLPTPRFQEFFHADDRLDPKLRFPLFAKPNREGTGKGIADKSIITTETQLRRRVDYLIQSYRQSVIVEDYVDGRDLTCGLVGNLAAPALASPINEKDLRSQDGLPVDYGGIHFFPISEVDYTVYPAGTEPVYSHHLKVDLADAYHCWCPAPLNENIAAEVRRLTLETFRVTHSFDVCRVDFRLAPDGTLYVLEINSLPGLTPISDLTLCAEANGWTHADLVVSVLNAAIQRHGLEAMANTQRKTNGRTAQRASVVAQYDS